MVLQEELSMKFSTLTLSHGQGLVLRGRYTGARLSV